MVAEPGVRLGIAHGMLVSSLLVAGGLGLGVGVTFMLTVVTAAVAALALGPVWRAGIGLSAWALFTGFAENRFGLLTFTNPDLARLTVLLVSTTVVSRLLLRWRVTATTRLAPASSSARRSSPRAAAQPRPRLDG